MKHTPLPWKMVSQPNFDSGLVYTSIQPVNVNEDEMKPLAMMNGEYHICRMSHTAAEWRFNYHRDNGEFIVRACNSYYDLLEAAKEAYEWMNGLPIPTRGCTLQMRNLYQAIAKAEGT